tara:strand:- start:1675 stop:2556 length:882 start_codon:yes stop_codon:yes gene_type:complete
MVETETKVKVYARKGRGDRRRNRLSLLAEMYMDIERLRVSQQIRQSHLKLDGSPFAEDPVFEAAFAHLKEAQGEIDELMMPLVQGYLCWTEFCEHVRGIGPHLLALVMGLVRDIVPFTNVSKLWWLCGLAVDHGCECGHLHSSHRLDFPQDDTEPAYGCSGCDCKTFRRTQKPGQSQKPVKGQPLNYDAQLKSVLLGRIGTQLLKNADPFARSLYDEFRAKEELKEEKGAHRRAIRKVVKLWVACLWEVWRRAEGLEVVGPYPMTFLGHTGFINAETWVQHNREAKKEAVEVR